MAERHEHHRQREAPRMRDEGEVVTRSKTRTRPAAKPPTSTVDEVTRTLRTAMPGPPPVVRRRPVAPSTTTVRVSRDRQPMPPRPPKRRRSLAPFLGAILGAVLVLWTATTVLLSGNQDRPWAKQAAPLRAAFGLAMQYDIWQHIGPQTKEPQKGDAKVASMAKAAVVRDANTVDVSVVVDPPGARVWLASRPDPKYTAPALIPVQRGEKLELVVEADGYEGRHETFDVPPGAHPTVQVALRVVSVPVIVRVLPRDAELTVDGRPFQGGMRAMPGQEIEIRATHPFYVEQLVRAKAVAGVPLELTVTLREKGSAAMVIDPAAEAAAQAAQVAQVAQVAQAASEAPDPAVDLTKKKKRAVVAKGTGTLVIMTSPAEALVVIDGKKLRAPTPTRALLPAGTHKIVVRLPPFREQSFAIDVVAGETVRKLVNLQ